MAKDMEKVFTGSWKDELKQLPKEQRVALLDAQKLLNQVKRFKFSIITIKQLEQELRILINESKFN